jgi:hypothetical protein
MESLTKLYTWSEILKLRVREETGRRQPRPKATPVQILALLGPDLVKDYYFSFANNIFVNIKMFYFLCVYII